MSKRGDEIRGGLARMDDAALDALGDDLMATGRKLVQEKSVMLRRRQEGTVTREEFVLWGAAHSGKLRAVGVTQLDVATEWERRAGIPEGGGA